ncbi:copper chaperone PCu(A)C [Wenjunlia tyrosinilytica]|uniref:Copper chaperone PCu(A)C n=1 Tax=Wenjunlia tyrosinilytica TaxID=1544741 RepID=A0A917ZLP3_9ACTN|nr:copper chaperone PCu(A)C [Wenjunlia tyrosinilytica]GGO86436.1 hypothetical protein GCM10012280_22540 [Wenjunlia tyrosinilytica]
MSSTADGTKAEAVAQAGGDETKPAPVKDRTACAGALVAVAALALLTGCGSSGAGGSGDGAGAKPRLSVEDPYVPRPASADMAAGYLTVRNTGKAADRLTEVTSDLTDDVTMHRTSGAGMEQVDGFEIPAGGRLVLSRGGNHLMLMGLSARPEVGEKVRFELHFATSGTIGVKVPVEPMTYRPPAEKTGS